MAQENIEIGTIQQVVASFRSIRIIDADGTERIASYGDKIYANDQIVSDDDTAQIAIKYNDIDKVVTYEGVFDIIADESVAQEADANENLVVDDKNTDEMETAAGEEAASNSLLFSVPSAEGVSVETKLRAPESEIETTQEETDLENTTNNGLDTITSLQNILLANLFNSNANLIFESELVNLGAGENSTYVGEKIVSNLGEIPYVSFDNINLKITTQNKSVISFLEEITNINNSEDSDGDKLQQVDILLSKLYKDDLPENQDEVYEKELSSDTIELLQEKGFLNIGLLPDGSYHVTSPLFNALNEEDVVSVSFDYSLDGQTNTIALDIMGVNDTPVAIEVEKDVTLNDAKYDGELPGTLDYTRSLLEPIQQLEDGSVSDNIDMKEVQDDIAKSVEDGVNLDVTSSMLDEIDSSIHSLVIDKLTQDIVNDIENYLDDSSKTFKLESVVNDLLVKLDEDDVDKTKVLEDFTEAVNDVYDSSLTQEQIEDISNLTDEDYTDTKNQLEDFKNYLTDNTQDIADSIDEQELSDQLHINSDTINNEYDTFLSNTKDAINDFVHSLDAKSLNDPLSVTDSFNDTLDQIYGDLKDSVSNEIGTEDDLKSVLTSALTDAIIQAADISEDDEFMKEVAQQSSQTLVSHIDLNVDDLADTTLESMFGQLGLNKDFLDDSLRSDLGAHVIQESFETLSLDEDLGDVATLQYQLVEGSVTVDGYSVDDDIVTLNNNGSYSVNLENLESTSSKVSFSYTLNDGGTMGEDSTSVAQKVTLHVEQGENRYESITLTQDGTIDLNSLVSTTDTLDKIELDAPQNGVLVNLEDVLDITDDDNTLEIVAADNTEHTIHLDNNFQETSHTDGVVTYTATLENETVTLNIEDTIHID